MDSVVGSIVMSWYYGSSVNPNYDPKGIKYIPVINCPKDELALRFDILENLSTFGIDNAFINANFLFVEDLRSNPELMDSVESVGLIDFNKINEDLEQKLGPKMHYILDHHVDSKLYLNTLKEKKVTKVGSAHTLLIEKIWSSQNLDLIPKDDLAKLALFLSAAIQLDTQNFKDHLRDHKWVNLDTEMFNKLVEASPQLQKQPKKYW